MKNQNIFEKMQGRRIGIIRRNRNSREKIPLYPKTVICEYIWIGGANEIRSKIRVSSEADAFQEWNFDGSSTGQVEHGFMDTEIILKPRKTYYHPFLSIDDECEDALIVLCDTWYPDGSPHPTNNRYIADEWFETPEIKELKPWFGLEQEYFLMKNWMGKNYEQDGTHYCGQALVSDERKIVEEHLHACIQAGLKISGLNAEVANHQWEFQIGPAEGIRAGDDMIVARFLLQRCAEKYEYNVLYHPKPCSSVNGSGCHINYSTEPMRVPGTGIEKINEAIKNLSEYHSETIAYYGEFNHLRLTGKHETGSIDKFTYGVGTRNTSVRIPNSTLANGRGYFEDRRPAANIDPYEATYKLSIHSHTSC